MNWNLKPLLGNRSVKKFYQDIEKNANLLLKLKGTIAKSEKNFLTFLTTSESLNTDISLLACYLHNQENTNLANNEFSKEMIRFENFVNSIQIKLSWINNELLENIKKLKLIISKSKKLSYLKFWSEEKERSLKHKLSDVEESLIAKLNLTWGNDHKTFTKLTNADFKFDPIKDETGKLVTITQGNAAKYLRHANIKVREQAYLSFWKQYALHKNTLATLYFGNLTETSTFAKVYKHKSSLEAALYGDNISVKFYDQLLAHTKNNSKLITKWKNILTKITKINNPTPWDWNGPLFEKYDKSFTVEEAKEIVLKALKPLGDDYLKKINYIFDNNMIDWMPKDNKRSGAYSYGVWKGQPFILLNWNSKYVDLSTLIHELGHSVHTLYSNENQPYAYHDYPIFLAEIASICNEVLLINYFLTSSKDKNFKSMILENAIKEFLGTVYRQVQFADFEKQVHDLVDKGTPLTAIEFESIAQDINEKYYPKLPTEKYKDDYLNLWGLFIPHFYSDFYVYKYATGMISACYFADTIINNKPNAVKNYINFLSSGCKNFPLEILKTAKLDLTKSDPYKFAFSILDNWLNELDKLT